jgi:hypothetical protein
LLELCFDLTREHVVEQPVVVELAHECDRLFLSSVFFWCCGSPNESWKKDTSAGVRCGAYLCLWYELRQTT